MRKLSILLTFAAIACFVSGCADTTKNDDSTAKNTAKDDNHEGHDHAGHDHTPPHGGHLIELGRNHEYHAELVDDHETESVTVYILDGDMKSLTIDQKSVSLIMTVADETKTFELAGSQPTASDQFKLSDPELMKMLEAEGATGKLRVTIKDKPYTGVFEHHDHSHDGHDH